MLHKCFAVLVLLSFVIAFAACVPTPTPLPTATLTAAPTSTATAKPSSSPTASNSPTPKGTSTPEATNTPIPSPQELLRAFLQSADGQSAIDSFANAMKMAGIGVDSAQIATELAKNYQTRKGADGKPYGLTTYTTTDQNDTP